MSRPRAFPLGKHFLDKISLRKLISLLMLCAYLAVALSGVLMFFNAHTAPVSLTHTVLGGVLLLAALWHIYHNLGALKKYLRSQHANVNQPNTHTVSAYRPSAVFMGVALLASALVVASLALWTPLRQVYEWGNRMRAGQQVALPQWTYERLTLPSEGRHPLLQLDLRAGPYFQYPTYAFWLESDKGEFLRPIYVTHKLAKNDFFVRASKAPGDADWQFVEEPETKASRWRLESLPVFLHRAGLVQTNPKVPVLDAYTGATMLSSFEVAAPLAETARRFRVFFEINHSFDFNDYYSEDRFPDDAVYSGSGYSGQPSLIYAADIDLDKSTQFVAMQLQGRGHHSGQDGEIHTDLDGMTTALELVDRIIIDVRQLQSQPVIAAPNEESTP